MACAATMFTLIIIGFIASVSSQNDKENEVRVTTEQGNVVGFKKGDYFAFHGIRYGGNITGSNRFKAAPPPPKLEDDFRADKTGIICAQPAPHGIVGVENCLTLNVFTRNVTRNSPVYVWLNGEDYSRTNDTPPYSFRSLVGADLVVIAVNYRLSIFGFLCLGVEQAPGNAGLKDVIQALKWIKANVNSFGGDPNNIILLGHGSGAAMVDLITLSPQSQDLVHKAIVISGSGLAPWAVAFDPAGYAKMFGAKLKYSVDDHQNLAKQFVNATIDDLVTAYNGFKFTNSSLLFAPCVENTRLSGCFLEDAPINLIKAGKFSLIPFVAIYVNDEGTLRIQEAVNSKWLDSMQENFVDFLPEDLKFENEDTRRNTSKNLRLYYFNSKNISKETIDDYFEYWGDLLVTVSMIRGVRERVAAQKKSGDSIFLMKFAFKEESNPNWPDHQIPLGRRTRHGAILKYIFDFDSVKVSTTPKTCLTNRFVAFAKTGIPVAPLESPGDVYWSPVSSEDLLYLSTTGDNTTNEYQDIPKTNPHNQSMEFWEKNIAKYYATPQGNWPFDEGSGSGSYAALCVLIALIIVVPIAYFGFKRFKGFKLPYINV